MNFSGQDFIYGCSAIGAGLAMIAGIGPGVGLSLIHILTAQLQLRIWTAQKRMLPN